MKPTLVLKARELAKHAAKIATATNCCVVPRPAPNPTLVAHGLVAASRWHLVTEDPKPRAVADLYVGTQAEAMRIARLMSNMLGQALVVLDNKATPAQLREHTRHYVAGLQNPSRSSTQRVVRKIRRALSGASSKIRKAVGSKRTHLMVARAQRLARAAGKGLSGFGARRNARRLTLGAEVRIMGNAGTLLPTIYIVHKVTPTYVQILHANGTLSNVKPGRLVMVNPSRSSAARKRRAYVRGRRGMKSRQEFRAEQSAVKHPERYARWKYVTAARAKRIAASPARNPKGPYRKMRPADFSELRAAVLAVIAQHPTVVDDYRAKGLSAERLRWDLLHASKFPTTRLYSYLDDSHIDTALRSIVGRQPNPGGPNQATVKAANAYISKIRNAEKKRYAQQYATHLLFGQRSPEAPASLSYMAAQAVRLQLAAIVGRAPNTRGRISAYELSKLARSGTTSPKQAEQWRRDLEAAGIPVARVEKHGRRYSLVLSNPNPVSTYELSKLARSGTTSPKQAEQWRRDLEAAGVPVARVEKHGRRYHLVLKNPSRTRTSTNRRRANPKGRVSLDDGTRKHLLEWLRRNRPGSFVTSRAAIYRALREDPESVDRGLTWTQIEAHGMDAHRLAVRPRANPKRPKLAKRAAGARRPSRLRAKGRLSRPTAARSTIAGRTRNPAGRFTSQVAKAEAQFRRWQDRGPIEVRKFRTAAPPPLTGAAAELGKVVAITYRTDKYDGKVKDHEHVFSAPLASLVTDPEARDLYIVRNRSRYAITPDGIVH